ncbi:Acid phosphatase pho1 [Pleodorina starrii]|uniref:Alpha-1,4 glucan phosphorylase n=1 Tax=Pleodorina starrii TaxID=330485 RepID=A0A9W6F5B7_9CHLO|nr:Acid phosphatase pho1 [Pleodorina starrii]GLC57088.1 Acid phosphatase pho1 [Pleodorina starrii]GLC64924.1 Acid phosphatase pho1 [Pleodorina starrii]
MASALRQGLSAPVAAPRITSNSVPTPVVVAPIVRSKAVAPARRTVSGARSVPAPPRVAAPESPAAQGVVEVTVDNSSDANYTVITVQAANKPGLLTSITALFRDLGVDVGKAVVEGDEVKINDTFYVRTLTGGKLSDDKAADAVRSLEVLLRSKPSSTDVSRPKFEAQGQEQPGKARLYTLMDTYMKNDVLSIQEDIVNHVEYTLARSRVNFDNFEAYQATSLSLRDRLIERWNDTQTWFKEKDPKRVYYLSMEFLMGRSLLNTLYNMDIKDAYKEALAELGYDLETLAELERDAALGNGGLGRLAACFLDSMATLNLPAWGYGIRYQYGMFRQTIQNGFQHEQPDYWLTFGNPWEIERLIVQYPIKFYGHVSVVNEDGKQLFRWNAGETVTAVAYDNPIPGFGTRNCINLRLWAAKPAKEFDLEAFNTGDYVAAILSKQRAETLSSVLYPDDRTYEGKELRLKQQHFFVSATIQDCVRRYRDAHPDTWDVFPDKVAFQLNDTHPTIAVAELMRVLMDEHKLGWTKSWEICTKVFAFTNHTVLPEALERWPVALIEKLLPRHMQIIYDVNWRFLQTVRNKYGDDWERISRMSIIEEGANGEKFVRMAYLAVVASHTVNGVAAIHSEIIKDTIFKDFYDLWPAKFQNKTNGVTQRRWLAFCNPPLRNLITQRLGSDDWILHLDNLRQLGTYADDPAFQEQWRTVKHEAKVRAAALIQRLTGIKINTNAMFDIQVKRIHEYKRQLLNVMGIIYRYDQIKKMSPQQRKNVVPRVCVIGGKAAPGYEMAKRIIKLVCAVGDKINSDPDVGDLLKLIFLPDYNVSSAEVLIPASELSQHISTAGTEASGTSNMKFTMNGSLIIGTLDGANVEIAEEIGDDNIFIFGAKAHEVPRLRAERRNLRTDERFNHVVGMIRSGHFGWEDYFSPVMDAITSGGDYYLVANDFPAYVDMQAKVDATYRDPAKWTRMSIMGTAGSGKFSTDRTIAEYARDIWHAEPCAVPQPGSSSS